jgi:ApaG protein
MAIAVTKDIKVSVDVKYNSRYSSVKKSNYIFNYTITITNESLFPMKLMTREWFVFDTLDFPRVVQGEGVVGQQPELEPGEVYTYTSSCDLQSTLGKMEGFYYFENLVLGEQVKVKIPQFTLMYPFLLN